MGTPYLADEFCRPIPVNEASKDVEDSPPSEAEDEDEYDVGGYHAAHPGELFKNGRYVALKKVGWGHFSTVWIAFDLRKGRHCAIKIQKSDSSYTDAAHDEIHILRLLKQLKTSHTPIVQLFDFFEHDGPNGRHACMVFEILSKSLLSLIKYVDYKGVALPMIKIISRQVLVALDFIHECRILHTDIKPENILFVQHHAETADLQEKARDAAAELIHPALATDEVPNLATLAGHFTPNSKLAFSSKRIKVVDFGNACLIDKQFASDIQTRQYRAPEVILGCGYDTKVDIWSLACVIFELATGDFLFDPHSSDDYDRDEDHLALMMELLGPLPAHMRERGTQSGEYFTDDGALRHISNLNFWSLRDVLREKYKYHPDDANELASFLLPMLYYDSEHRHSAEKLLMHSFLNEPSTVAACQCELDSDVIDLPRDMSPISAVETQGPMESLPKASISANPLQNI